MKLDESVMQRLESIAATGSKLPTERALSEEFGVSRHAIRKILNSMELEGRLWRHVGRGTFAGQRPTTESLDLSSLGRASSPREIVEVRQMIEPQIAAAAALRASTSQIATLQTALQRSMAARSMDDYEAWDELFHRTIVEACGNPLLAGIYQAVNQARIDVVWIKLSRSMFEDDIRQQFAKQHSQIAEGIAERNPDKAWTAMRNHMLTTAEIYTSLENRQLSGTSSLISDI
ncbi:FadR/GntR family transcriptional regulator [Pseudomonas gingeri]|uniref:FadR/GntR family transcriptional regulator n=1 Tax=Pseudomonas gingeri TaxID=117681 RepID=UPI0015A15B53|nr:FCD domain-containing protein [Pseudomonas gingeri]NWD04170.1 FadR family transcriptional regulator [Pseudomonas gingeri]NWE34198.1 FadR family transcriptional regulator [Pseudomonas gingeri]NWE56550.1 FadR family transcriptional regulator [Pseudomonas gingeri]NWF01074.1 FadR family transcriptional regulator [Pseudomonas gingeri]